MADPHFAIELGNLSMLLEKPPFRDIKELPTAEETIQIAELANKEAFDIFTN